MVKKYILGKKNLAINLHIMYHVKTLIKRHCFKPGLNKLTMTNFTSILMKHCDQWQLLAIDSFAPVYPTSIRGSEYNQRGYPGD